MASMRSIKRRRESVQSTQQITKAMKLVSTVKLQRAKQRAEQSKSYFHNMYSTVKAILARAGSIRHPYLEKGKSTKKAIIMITSNRGLAGGYNSNVIKLVTRSGELKKEDCVIYAVGKKGKDALRKAGYEIAKDYSDAIEEPIYVDAMNIVKDVLADFEADKVGEIFLAYTGFKNTVSHEPTLLQLLPVDLESSGVDMDDDGQPDDKLLMNFEMNETDAISLLIPKYMTSIVFGAMIEAVASENGARMQAMDSATSNAEDMISALSLQYNRARQSSITQELTEIIAGADAIG
ncbi:MAG: ATP synthase F1 subunit gamma [Lachnospiraceae bacterium]|nr:ATP synthase F1 subunit gamma [Lachnospiraceae bacterium]